MHRHAWPTASDVVEMVKLVQISAHPVINSILNRSALNGWISWLCWIRSGSPPSPCMCQSSTHLFFALHVKPQCQLHCMFAAVKNVQNSVVCAWHENFTVDSKLWNKSTCVTVFAFLLHRISICGCVIDPMSSGLHWNNSGMSINHEWYMRTEASNAPTWGQHICPFHVSCEHCSLSRAESLSELLQVFKASRWSHAHTNTNLCAFAHERRASKPTLASAAVCLFHCSAAMRRTALD